jgi:8-oxo-dGTP diphosphatase
MQENVTFNWLPHAHKAKIIVDAETTLNPTDISSSFIFAFKGKEVLLAQVYSRGWDIPGGHREHAETPEETVSRELFEECGTHTDLMGPLGHIEIHLEGDTAPNNYPYPFPISYLMFYWGIVSEIGTPSSSMEVGEPRFFSIHEALKLDCIKDKKILFNEALKRAQIVAEKLNLLQNNTSN